MPTPVDVARQCLAEAAAAVLDDAVAVAKRRSHAQTTSLHIISALLALPSSTLREACTRTRSSAYSPRLQFRALELCIGVALDRVSVSKSAAEEPPVSNSLLAAIKRSQANQRRHPETFHLYQQQLNSISRTSPSISTVKVELKHFVMSILDDPIVSRVLGDAGLRTHEIKMAILNPLNMSRFSSINSRHPPLFSCSLSDLELNKPGHSFPFSKAMATERVDENAKRIAEILSKSSRRNPLLVGAYASDASRIFIDCLKRGGNGVLPKEIDGLSLASIEHEISECFTGEEGSDEEMIGLKFKQVDEMVKDCQGPGIIVNCGDLKVLVDVELVNVVNYLVLELKRLVINHGRKLWLIGFMAGDGDYKKLVERFPSIEMDWDLHLLPITTASTGEKCFESSLLRSFVPFGGFFSMPSEDESPCTTAAKTSRLCNLCSEKYDREVSDVFKGVSTTSVAAKESISLSSWLQIAECETSKRSSLTAEAKQDKIVLDVRVIALKRKWRDICRRLHSSSTSQENITLPKPQTSSIPSFQNFSIQNDTAGVGSSLSGRQVTNSPSLCMPSDLQKTSLPKPEVPTPIDLSERVNTQAKIPGQGLELNDLQWSLPIACTTPSPPAFSVATNLRLGTLYDSAEECTRKLDMREHYESIPHSKSSRSYEISSSQVSRSSSSWSHHPRKEMYAKDLENPWRILAEKVYWQMEAVQNISRTVSRCRNGNENGNVWLGFVGRDKVGKRKIASGVAEIVFGRKEKLLSLDLNSDDVINPSNSIVDCYDSKCHKLKWGRKMIVDYLAEELSKHPHSVVLLENVDKADFLVRDSLSRAIKTGKFPDSHGREVIINNNVFVLALTALKVTEDVFFGKVASEFPEDKILEAKNFQMQILVGYSDGSSRRNSTTNVSVTSSKIIFKRKSSNNGSTKAEMSKRACRLSRSIIDLNLPVEDMEEDSDNVKSDDENDNSDNSQVWLEELLEHVDENVVFKPFDFDSLSQQILKDIDARLKNVAGATVWLEIDQQVMVQILAAAWITDRKNTLEYWIEQVLCLSIEEARQRCNVASDVVMRLVPHDGFVVEAQAVGLCLPARINLI